MTAVPTAATEWMNALVEWLPVGYAFGAGMLSTVNPCGIAMLPAYLALYLGLSGTGGAAAPSLPRRLARALVVSLAMSAGFMVLFGALGLLLSASGEALRAWAPWAAVLVGAILIALGLAWLAGRKLPAAGLERLAGRLGDPRRVSLGGFFLFGVGYGITSVSCTLPIFLLVVGGAVAAGGFWSGVLPFLGYGLGMGAVVAALTLGSAVCGEALRLGRARAALARLRPAAAVLLVLAGAYIVYYWLATGGLWAAAAG